MKRIFRAFSVLTLSILACAALSAPVGAATLSNNFKDINGKVFQTETVLSIEKVGTAINIRDTAGSVHSYVDNGSGSVMSAVLASAYVTSHYVQVPGQSKYMHTTNATEVICYSGTQTAFSYPGTTPAEFFADGCQLWQAVKAVSN